MKKLFTLIAMMLVIGQMAFAQSARPQWTKVTSDNPATFQTQLISSSEKSIQVNVQVPGFYTTPVSTPNGEAFVVTVPKSVSTAQAGEPDVPMTGIPVMIGDRANMNVRVLDAKYMDFENIEIAPSKGDFPRTIDPATVPYTYGECYKQDAFFPASNLEIYEPYIIRDFRGQNMAVFPFAYNPVTKTLRVYYDMTVEMYKVNDNGVNTIETRRSNVVKMSQDFKSVYQRHFINYEEGMSKYTALDEEGDLLIICYDNFISAMTDFVNWKKTRGINTTIVGTSTAGSTASAIKTYITNQYNANNNLTHVLLVGDVAQIPGNQFSAQVSSSNDYSGYGDNLYGQIVGSDIYNDLFIGRFTATSTAHVATQVQKVITYERDLTTSASWLQKGVGISRKENGSGHNNEDDYQHMDNIRTDLLGYGYTTVTQRYANLTGYDASASTISSDINSGAGIVCYANHGQETAWGANSSGYVYYANSHVNALTNDNKLPFIFSVACLVGKYDHSTDCFAETWMKATNNSTGAPTGAVGTLMSYISQPWIPPMWAQDECIDILVDSYSNNIKHTWGGVSINGLMGIFDHYATTDKSSIGTYQAWVLYGDPSLMLRTKTPQAMTVSHAGTIAPTGGSYTVNVTNGNGAVVTITDANHNILGKATVANNKATINVSGSLTVGSELTVCVFGYNKQTELSTITVTGGTQYTISATANPANGGTVTGAGQYYGDTQCALTATPATHYEFVNWSNGSTANPLTFTVTGDATYTANFRALTEHHITYVPQQTHGTIGVSPVNAYAGDIVTLTATAEAGYCLHAWHVTTTGKAEIPVVNNQFVMPDAEVTITADFGEGFAITMAPVMNGTISSDKSEAAPGETVTLTAVPATGYDFNGWVVYQTGDISNTVTVTDGEFTMPSFNVTVSAVFSQPSGTLEVTIGSGTSTSAYLPTYAYYKYSLTQQIYSHGEVGCAGTITKVAFKVSNSKSTTRSLDIYMSHTSSTEFESTTGWIAQSTSERVYSGSVTFSASDWTVITLQTPFEYDGTSNLLLTVDDNTNSYVSSSSDAPSFYVYSAIGNTALYKYNDNTNYNPASMSVAGSQLSTNNQVVFTKVVPNAGYLSVSPNALTGFSYMEGQGPSESQTITVVGNADDAITVTAPADYEVSLTSNGTYSGSLSIAAGSKALRGSTTWDFEGDLLDWTSVDKDGDGYEWGVRSTYGYNSDYSVTSESYHNNESGSGGTALNPDNWLVSPEVTLKGVFSFWAQAQDAAWAAEHIGVYVSTSGSTVPGNFVKVDEWTLGAKKGVSYSKRGGGRAIGTWNQYSVDLSAYNGQSGYIAIRHFDCTDMFAVNVDCFTLGDAPVVPISGDLVTANVYVRLKDGLTADTYANETLVVSVSGHSANVTLSGEVIPGSSIQHTITVVASPVEGGTVSGGGTYYEGSHRNITATPNAHYTFTGWELNGSIVSTDNPYNITVLEDATYTAVFTEDEEYDITITQAAGGTITASAATAYPGDVVTLSVTTESGYFLESWNVTDANSQAVTVSNNQFTMPASDVTVTATFTQGFEVTVNQTANGTISVDKTTGIQPGEIVTLTATPDANCVLKTWYVFKTGDPRAVVSVVNDSYFKMPSSDVTVMAVFVTTEQFEASVGSGTSTNNYIPTYVRSRYSLSEQIYLASDLSNKAGTITKIAFRATTRTATRNLIIYMRPTTKSSFSGTTDWETMGEVYKVFEGSVSFSTSDWTTITLDTPFEYDGTSNINLCVVDETGSTTGSTNNYTKFYRTDAANRALYANGSSSYASSVGFSNSLSSVTGTRISYVNRVNFTMTVPGSAESLTVSPGEMDDFSYVVGDGPSNTHKLDVVGVDLQNNVTLTAPTNFEMSLTEDGTYGSSLTVTRETGSKGGRAVTIWDFDNGMQNWTAVDADGDGSGWVLGSAIGGVYLEEGGDLTGEGHNDSNDLLVSGSYSNVNGVLTPDNWVISPEVELGGTFSLWASALDDSYYAEHFGIYVSTTGTSTSSFTLLNEWTLSNGDWHQYTVDLSEYAGEHGYIAVRHYNCTNMFCLLMDDFDLDTDATITIELPVTITPATVYVRMKDSLGLGSYSGTLTASAGSGTALNGSVSLSGEVKAQILATANPSEGGTVAGAGTYSNGASVTVRATASEGYVFVNWTENNAEVSTDANYTFTVSANRTLVANFELASVDQTITLSQGYNWFTPTVGMTLEELETALGTNGISITAQDGKYVEYDEDEEEWDGNLMSLVPGKMYKIQAAADCSFTVSGEAPESVSVTIVQGYNWFGYTGTTTVSVEAALGSFTPAEGDRITSFDRKFADYEDGEWDGNLQSIEPGKGYIYDSKDATPKPLALPGKGNK